VGVDLLRDDILRVREADPLEAPPPSPMPEVAIQGRCALCGQHEATAACVHCGARVCGGDHWVMFGLCRACLTEDEMRAARAPKARPRPDLGIKWIEE
jgi:ribosomal protein S14